MPTAVALATPILTALTCLPISKRSEETKEVLDKKENRERAIYIEGEVLGAPCPRPFATIDQASLFLA